MADGKECSITLTQEQADALVTTMTKAVWQSHQVDAEYDCSGMIGEIPFQYASASGHLTVDGYTVQLSISDRIDLNRILGIDTYITIE